MHLENHPFGGEPHRLVHRVVVPDVAGHGIHRAIAARAPEELVERQRYSGGHAIGSTGNLSQRKIEDDRLGIDQRGQRIVVPGRVDLGHVSQIERGGFKADEIAQQFEQIEQRIDVIMRLILRAHLRIAALLRRGRDMAVAHIHAGVDGEPAKVGKTEGFGGHIDQPHWLPEAEGQAWPDAAKAHRQAGIGWIGLVARPKVEPADREREEAIPANVGDGIGEMAMAGGRALRLRHLRRTQGQAGRYHRPEPARAPLGDSLA